MGHRLNRLDELVFIAVSKPLLTEFGIHLRFESWALYMYYNLYLCFQVFPGRRRRVWRRRPRLRSSARLPQERGGGRRPDRLHSRRQERPSHQPRRDHSHLGGVDIGRSWARQTPAL